mmetsp:Transcript_21875/g.44325  ORF Transcript_21875/g.44325 Transcript_21875/m.44325 type:complete len:84 (+) Transcript_21875:288-539(+)
MAQITKASCSPWPGYCVTYTSNVWQGSPQGLSSGTTRCDYGLEEQLNEGEGTTDWMRDFELGGGVEATQPLSAADAGWRERPS